MKIIEKALEIIRLTNDGDDLSPEHMKLVENGVNGFLSEFGEKVFDELYQQVLGGYKKPWFHGIENMTIDQEGYIYWKDKHVEHYDFPFAFGEKGEAAAQELGQRCLFFESKGIDISCARIIWGWKDSDEKEFLEWKDKHGQ